MIPRITLATFLTFALCLAAAAQDKLIVRTMALSSIETPPLFLATSSDEKWQTATWPQRQPSRPVETFIQEGVLSLFIMNLNPESKNEYTVAHQIKIPSGSREILLFAWMASGKLQLQPVADDFLGRNHDRWLLINFSSKQIAFRVGDESTPVILKKKTSKLYKINVAEDKPASILGQARIRGDKPKLFYSSYFPVKKGRRTIVIFTDYGDKIRTKLIADLFPVEKKNHKKMN